MMTNTKRPTRCIDPVMQYCQNCIYGYVEYPEWVETHEDLEYCTVESGCMLGLDNTKPTEEELKQFEEWIRSKDKINEEKI